ncbi:MAG: acyl-CoA thioesterase [Candidatus Tectomicrobia bacterium]|uniref:Acyl-CoA thioesterase n=1 Tax=Tectimicrobiota bacterium TaxID=2528274 RepID=A0A932ZTA7_UNCTE|nr:acyl-CoA thioesterase [Candidatus Tectomicrobia bacterium]MBI4251100.1 acyl-CoA thioesterase [Candidatus Tectomicrobia bacterium]
MPREEFRYKTEFRVRFGETDLQGVVFNANYLLYVDTAQMDYLRDIGVPYSLMRGQGHDVVIAEAHLQFKSPARFDEIIDACARVSDIGNASFQMEFELYERESGRLVAAARTVYVIVQESTGEPIRVPPYLRRAVREFEGNGAIAPE